MDMNWDAMKYKNANKFLISKGGHFSVENVKTSHDPNTDNIFDKLILTIHSTASMETNSMIEMLVRSIPNLKILFRYKDKYNDPSITMQGPYTEFFLLPRLVPQNVEFRELGLFLTDFGERTKKIYDAMKKIVDNADFSDLNFNETLTKIVQDYFETNPFELDDMKTNEEETMIEKPQENDNIKRHAKICDELTKLYERKNHDYGDSFHQTYVEEGLAMSRIRLSDKLSRFNKMTRLVEDKGLASKYSGKVKDESIRDTLIDLANYSIMTIMELDREDKS